MQGYQAYVHTYVSIVCSCAKYCDYVLYSYTIIQYISSVCVEANTYSNADTMGVLLAHVFVANQCACMFEFTHMYTYTHAHNCNSYVYTLVWKGYKYAGYMYVDIRRCLNLHRLSVMFNWPIKVAHWSPSLHISVNNASQPSSKCTCTAACQQPT